MHLPPPPDSRQLLPPLLACLPTAFISRRPPPALLPLLSPLLRQRISFLSPGDSSRSDGWLPLLSWSPNSGAKLPDLVERMHLEPHPISGEVEIEDVRPTKYRRLDEETLQARLDVDQFEIAPIYLWCETDEHGGTGPSWKLAELRSLEDSDDSGGWFDSISKANDAGPAPSTLAPPEIHTASNGHHKPASSQGDNDDDDYWAAYDRTPGRTPAQKHSPAPQNLSQFQPSSRQPRSQAELDYYSRYGNEVQPALDAHDPDEETPEIGQSTLNGNALLQPQAQRPPTRPLSRPTGASLYPADPSTTASRAVEAPRPISPTSSHSSIERLEARARAISDAQQRHHQATSPTDTTTASSTTGDDRAQLAIKQHISTDLKSLFRLARNTGMAREDFERIVRTELECLSLLEQDD